MVSFPTTPSSSTRDSEKEIDDMLPVAMSRTTVKFHMCSASSGRGEGEGEAADGCGVSGISSAKSTVGLVRLGIMAMGMAGSGPMARARAMAGKRRMTGQDGCIMVDVAVVGRVGELMD